MSTRPEAQRAFLILATLVALLGAYHLSQAFGSGAAAGAPVWYHPVIGVLYLLAAAGLLFRPPWFVVAFGLVTLYAVLAAVVMSWRSATGTNPFNAVVAVGFVVFPVALNLLLADAIHERTESAAPIHRRQPRGNVPS
ncbi:MAG: hypothetical protein MUC69_11240 [Gemmatimonadales bacterium]|jgi:hypothetical protein|nr:hypothetical protein [Gemmatimonadales bacterium]